MDLWLENNCVLNCWSYVCASFDLFSAGIRRFITTTLIVLTFKPILYKIIHFGKNAPNADGDDQSIFKMRNNNHGY